MSLSAHFYDTMIAGLFCLAMVPGFIFCIFKKNYFWSILRTGLLSILIAILPMGIAFAFGTPLQGSLGWGMEIITGKTEEDTQETEIGTEFEFETEFESEIGIDTEIGTETQIGTESSSELLGDSQFEEIPEEEIEGEPGIPQGGVQIQEPKKESLVKRLGRVIRKYPGVVVKLLKEYIFVENFSWAVTAFLIGLCLLFVFGVICFRFGNLWYGGVLVTVGVYQFLMITLLASKELGLPALMDASRTSIFLTYTLVCVPFFITDICCVRIRRRIESNKVAKTISAVAYAAIALVLCTQGLVKPPVFVPRDGMMQTNGAIVCVTNLMRYHERNNWTIVSANDERNMIYNYGRHEELWNFVFEMETYSALKTRIIPTEEVYFFIEKQPLFCLGDETFEGMFETITPEDARHPLSNSFGNDFYKGKVC